MGLKFISEENSEFFGTNYANPDQKEHPVFKREGNELTTKMKITLSEVINILEVTKFVCAQIKE